MIISPPFLPLRTTAQTDAEWLEAAMPPPGERAVCARTHEGSFPVSAHLQWHNGVHIDAPRVGGVDLPVRAIADGIVVYARTPVARATDPKHPQNYTASSRPAWTDNGMLIVEHKTEIGATGNDGLTPPVPTEITYYSLYMHLCKLGQTQPRPVKGVAQPTRDWKTGDRIYRKDVIGTAGLIYEAEGQLHFEICCDEANLKTLLNLTDAPVWAEPKPPTADGRTDSVFGNLYIFLPEGTPTSASRPTSDVRRDDTDGAKGPVIPEHGQWVEIRYDKGAAHVCSRDIHWQPLGTYPPVPLLDFEYDLYAEANKRHTNYVKHDSDTRSSPSGWYELLRFGRNIGPDPLPKNAAHWRQIPTVTGTIWADLNGPNTCKFSDADFPPVSGWNCFGDDTSPQDQRCDSPDLKRRIFDPDPLNEDRMKPEQLAERLGEKSVQTALRKAICKFPTEWDRATVAQRYSWQRDPALGLELEDDTQWERFVRHCEALTFADLPEAYTKADWKFRPAEFIGVLRRCGWLSASELHQIYTRTTEPVREMYRFALNKVASKYLYSENPVRLSHFLGQGAIESGWLTSMQEISMKGRQNGANLFGETINKASTVSESSLGHWYGELPSEDDPWFRSNKYNSRGKLISSSYNWRNGNLGDPDAQKFRGRGFKQITGLLNYSKY